MRALLTYGWVIGWLLGIVSCQTQSDLPTLSALQGEWQFRRVNDTVWYPAIVPGTVHTDLLHNNLIEDPFAKDNETNLQWISETGWEYLTEFKVHPDQLRKKHLELTFEGLDTYASVFLNDSLILIGSNAFREYTAEVASLLQATNTLRILFEPIGKFEKAAAAQLPYQLPEGNRIFTRKPQFQYGWDWAPAYNTCGVWRPITLSAWNALKIDDLYVDQVSLTHDSASLELQITHSPAIQGPLTYRVYVNDTLHGAFVQEAVNGLATVPVNIQNPKRWWPHNLGDPYLYTVQVEVLQGETLLDQAVTKTGLRTVDLVKEKDDFGTSFFFAINGVPVYAKGANYIPQNSFQTEVTPGHYERLLKDAKRANMNMLRVWGGGIYEQDAFYDLADEKGIMVWQDFMFACAMYPGDSAFLENAEQEAIQNVRRLRNHPSIVLWCGNNESSEGWHRWGWQDGRGEAEKNEIWWWYKSLFDTILPTVVSSLSRTPYWESSPLFGRGNPEYLCQGDAHDWWVWHNGFPFEHLEAFVPRFMSEFGFQSIPDRETVKAFIHAEEIDFETDAFQNHQKHARGFELIDTYMRRDFPIPPTPEDYIYVSQLVQAYGIVKGIEAQRRSKPQCMGSLFWQLNDCWPAISWSSIDFYGRWKALQYAAQKAFADLLISSTIEADTLNIFLVNDNLTPQSDTLRITMLDFRGKILRDTSLLVQVDANSSQTVFQMPRPFRYGNPESTVMKVSFGNHMKIVSFVNPKSLNLPASEITWTVTETPDGYVIELNSEVFEKNVYLQSAIPGFFSDNFFDLLPNEPYVVHFYPASEVSPDFSIVTLNDLTQLAGDDSVKPSSSGKPK